MKGGKEGTHDSRQGQRGRLGEESFVVREGKEGKESGKGRARTNKNK